MVFGCVAGAHGLEGRIRVRCFGDGPDNLLRLGEVWLGAGPQDASATPFAVRQGSPGPRGEVLLALAGVSSREAAAALRGRLVLGDASVLPSLPEGEFYWFELVGCRVEDTGGRPIGTVRELWDPGAHDLLVVVDEDGREILIPAVADLLRTVDVEEGRIVVEVIPGLLDSAP